MAENRIPKHILEQAIKYVQQAHKRRRHVHALMHGKGEQTTASKIDPKLDDEKFKEKKKP